MSSQEGQEVDPSVNNSSWKLGPWEALKDLRAAR